MTPSDDVPADPAMLTDKARREAAGNAMRRCWMLTGGLLAASALALASCVPPAPQALPPAPAPAPSPTPTAAPPPPVQSPTDWLAQPLTLGDWHYLSNAATSRALFRAPSGEVVFTVACELAAGPLVRLWRPADATVAPVMTITTTESVEALSVAPSPAVAGQVATTLTPHAPVLDAMVFTRGRFAVEVAGTETLYLPSWPEIARVVEDCR